MGRGTVKPSDKRKYAAVKGDMKKKKGKGRPGSGGDPKAFRKFKSNIKELEQRQRDRRQAALNTLFKLNEKWLKLLAKIRDDAKLPVEQKRALIEKIIREMMDNLTMTPAMKSAMKSALDKKSFEQEVRKAVGALPDDDQNAAQGHVDAILRNVTKEAEETKRTLQDTARLLNNVNKKVSAGGMPDPVLIAVALVGICQVIVKKLKGKKKS